MLDDRPPIFYQLTPATLADGQQAHGFRCDSRGALMVSSTNAGVSTVALADNADAVAVSATVNGDKVVARDTVFNGTSWDRMRKTNLTARLVSAAASTNATSVKASTGIAYALTVNGADADTTALTAADVESLNITYA